MLENPRIPDNVWLSGQEHLSHVHALNQQGRFCVFAPNHLKPESAWRTAIGYADDYSQWEETLNGFGLSSAVLFRGDTDLNTKDNGVMTAIYDIHRVIHSWIGRLVTGGGIPININVHDSRLAASRNTANILEVFRTLKERNMTIHPYGNWFESKEQTFDEKDDLDGDEFVSQEEFDRWRTALKEGFFRIVHRARTPIVPVYTEHTGAEWIFRIGPSIEPEGATIDTAKRYLASMRKLQRHDGNGD